MSADVGLRISDFDIAVSKIGVNHTKMQVFMMTLDKKNGRIDRKIAVKSKKNVPEKSLIQTTRKGSPRAGKPVAGIRKPTVRSRKQAMPTENAQLITRNSPLTTRN